MTDQQKQKPIETHRDGRLTAAIWANPGEHGPIYNVRVTYSYQDKNENWHDTPTIPANELLKAARLSEMAYASVARLKDQDRAAYAEQQRSSAEQAQGQARGPAR